MDSSPLALLAQTCNAIGLPDPTSTGDCKCTNINEKMKNQSKRDSNMKSPNKDDSKAPSSIKQSTAADSTSETPSTGRRSTSSNSDQNKKGDNKLKQVNVSSSDTKISTVSDSNTVSSSITSQAGLGSKCNLGNPLAFPSSYPPILFPPFLPPTSSTATAPLPFGVPPHFPMLSLAPGAYYPALPGALLPPGPMLGFPPKCTDPFCKTCPATAATAIRLAAPCGTAGCPCGGGNIQNADLSSLWLSYGSLFGLHSSTNPATANPFLAAAASAYAASSIQQHTCSWMSGNEFCGKRFNSSDELLQHLRTHTSQDSIKAQITPTPTTQQIPIPISGRLSPRGTVPYRFHPYQNGNKFSPSAAAAAATLASLQFQPTSFNAQTICASLGPQKLPATLPQP